LERRAVGSYAVRTTDCVPAAALPRPLTVREPGRRRLWVQVPCHLQGIPAIGWLAEWRRRSILTARAAARRGRQARASCDARPRRCAELCIKAFSRIPHHRAYGSVPRWFGGLSAHQRLHGTQGGSGRRRSLRSSASASPGPALETSCPFPARGT
jgi:hypothetical protein